MTDVQPHDDQSSDDAVGVLLAQRYSELVHHFAQTLDLEAGLSTAVITAEQERLRQSFRDGLDLNAGLVGAHALDAFADQERGVRTFRDLVKWFEFRRVSDLLDFRTHVAIPEHARIRECNCIETRKALIDLAQRQLADVEHAAAELATELTPDAHLAIERTIDELRNALKQADLLEYPFSEDLERLLSVAAELREQTSAQTGSARLREEASDLWRNFDQLELSMNDFQDRNLERIDLTGIDLKGVRWSHSTRWPAGWLQWVSDNSVELSPGVFVIRGRNQETEL